jgi:DNA modification methylase
MAERISSGDVRVNKWKLEVVEMPISQLKLWDKNPRDNDKAAIKLAELLKQHGIINPVVITPDNVVRAGNTRVKAATIAGFKTIPTIKVPFSSEKDAVAFSLSDNKASEFAKWDVEKLQAIFAADVKIAGGSSLQEAAHSSGFKASEIEGILAIADFSRADMVPAMPAAAVSRKGEVYQLGRHRLMCGDSSSTADVDRLLAGAKIHLVNTDPPYNVKVASNTNAGVRQAIYDTEARRYDFNHGTSTHNIEGFVRNSILVRGNRPADIAQAKNILSRPMNKPNDCVSLGKLMTLSAKDVPPKGGFVSNADFDKSLRAWFDNIARVLIPGCPFYIWGGYSNLRNYLPILDTAKPDLHFAQIIVWIKSWPVFSANRKDFMGDSELCFYGWKEGAQHRWYGPTNAKDVWDIKDPNPPVTDVWRVRKVAPTSMCHLTEKPVELATRALQYSSQAGENVLDLFGGSGSTLIGCEQMNRHAFLMELDTLYCDVIRQRWSDFVYGKDSKWQSLTPAVR